MGHLRPDFLKSVVVTVMIAGSASPALPVSRVLSYTRDVRYSCHLFLTTGPCPVPALQLAPGNRGRQETSKSLRPSALGLLVLARWVFSLSGR